MISLSNVTLQRGHKVLLQQASLTIHASETLGIIGKNGSGKSSLFKLLTGELDCQQGDIKIPKKHVIAHLAQEIEALEQRSIEYVLDGDSQFRAIQNQINSADEQQLPLLYEKFENIDGYRIESKAYELLNGLGFNDEACQQPVKSFSGGWRMRLNLARTLMIRSDIMLLDEPTNHLDLDAVIFLERFLRKFEGTLILISHDKSFLNNLCDHIVEIEHHSLHKYTGNYDTFQKTKAEKLALQEKAYQKQQDKIAHLQKFIDRFKAKASKAKQAQSRVKALDKMTMIAQVQSDHGYQFEFQPCKATASPMIEMTQVAFGFESPLISNLDFSLQYGERIGLLGPNGAGKSTFMKLLANEKTPLSGRLEFIQHHLTIGYYQQHQIEQLPLDDTPMQLFQRQFKSLTEQQIRNFLGGFMFDDNVLKTPIRIMSGGEKARLVLALLIQQKPNLLLLDEPTNHLDLAMRDALELALLQYPGTLVLISHDQALLESTVDSFYLVNQGQVKAFEGNMHDYIDWLQGNTHQSKSKSVKKTVSEKKSNKNKIKAIETQLVKLHAEQHLIETELALDETYQSPDKLAKLLEKQSKLSDTITTLESEWITLSS